MRINTANTLKNAADSLDLVARFNAGHPNVLPALLVSAVINSRAAATERAAEIEGLSPPPPPPQPPVPRRYHALAVLMLVLSLMLAAKVALAASRTPPVSFAAIAIAAPPRGQVPTGWGKIGLSAEQKSKIYQTQADFRTKKAALEEQLATIKAAERAALFELLTDGQRQALASAAGGPAKQQPPATPKK